MFISISVFLFPFEITLISWITFLYIPTLLNLYLRNNLGKSPL